MTFRSESARPVTSSAVAGTALAKRRAAAPTTAAAILLGMTLL
jgi:hypothetical protein